MTKYLMMAGCGMLRGSVEGMLSKNEEGGGVEREEEEDGGGVGGGEEEAL